MRLEGRRESTNVEDRRGMSGGAIAGGIGGGALIIALIVMLLGGDPTSVLQNAGTQTVPQNSEVTFSQEEQELASFAKKILAGTEDVWTAQFAKYGYEYQAPKMVLYTGVTSSGCGTANSQVGPFYCSADNTVYMRPAAPPWRPWPEPGGCGNRTTSASRDLSSSGFPRKDLSLTPRR